MESFKVDLMNGKKVISSVEVAAQSHVHAVMKTVPKPLKLGRAAGKPWIRVTHVVSKKTSEFHVSD